MVALIERRIWTPLDYRRDRHHAGTHSDALRTAAQAVPVPQLSQRWPARRFANVKVLTATGPTRLRDRPTGPLQVCLVPGVATPPSGLTGMMVTARVADSGLSGTVP